MKQVISGKQKLSDDGAPKKQKLLIKIEIPQALQG